MFVMEPSVLTIGTKSIKILPCYMPVCFFSHEPGEFDKEVE